MDVPAQELQEWLHIGPLQERSHMWTGATMLSYLRFLGEEIRARRKILKLPQSAKCLVLCDQATQHSAKAFDQLRSTWESQFNAATRLAGLDLVYIYIYMQLLFSQFVLNVYKSETTSGQLDNACIIYIYI